MSSLPSCSSIPPGWKGEWLQTPTNYNPSPGITISSPFPPGTWHLVYCVAGKPGYTGSGNTGTTGSGNAGTTG
jgi:hypothetical protein